MPPLNFALVNQKCDILAMRNGDFTLSWGNSNSKIVSRTVNVDGDWEGQHVQTVRCGEKGKTMVSHLSPVSMAYDIGKRLIYSRRHPNIVAEVESRLFDQVVHQFVTCIGKGTGKCEQLQRAIAQERAKPRRTGAGGLADTSRDSSSVYSDDILQLQLELQKYRRAAACAYIAGGKSHKARAELAQLGFSFDDEGNIQAPAEWNIGPLPTSQKEAVRGVPLRAKQVARSILWAELMEQEQPQTGHAAPA